MATMTGFDHILNWKLKEGSHLFPGKDGGPCINEAAQLRLRTRHPRRMVPQRGWFTNCYDFGEAACRCYRPPGHWGDRGEVRACVNGHEEPLIRRMSVKIANGLGAI
jgi:hypothetical protein